MARNGKAQTVSERLEAARTSLAAAETKIGELEASRRQALAADKDAEAARLDGELEQHRRLLRVHTDKIALLEGELAEELRQKQIREQAALIARIKKTLAGPGPRPQRPCRWQSMNACGFGTR